MGFRGVEFEQCLPGRKETPGSRAGSLVGLSGIGRGELSAHNVDGTFRERWVCKVCVFFVVLVV